MSILTNDEINALSQSSEDTLTVIRETERAVIAKLAAGVNLPEPEYKYGKAIDGVQGAHLTVPIWAALYTLDQLNTAIAAARVQTLEEAANIAERENAADWSISGQIAREIRTLIGKEST